MRPTHFVGATELEKVLEGVMPKEVPNSLPPKTVSNLDFLYQMWISLVLKHEGFVFKTLEHPNRQLASTESFGCIESRGPIRSFARPVDKAARWE